MRGFYNYDTRPAFTLCSSCGKTDAYWHHYNDSLSEFCCDECWPAIKKARKLSGEE